MLNIKIKKTNPEAVIPKIMTSGSACADVTICKIENEGENKVIVSLGFALEIPQGYKAVIVPRSSFTHKGWILQNSPAQFDSDYRGEYKLKFEAIPNGVYTVKYTNQIVGLRYPLFPYKVGDRIAQIYFEKIVDYSITEVDELSSTERGEGGFGSTNK